MIPTHDKSVFFEMIKEQHKYQIGDEFFLLRGQKIVKGNIHRVRAAIYNRWSYPKIELNATVELELLVNGSLVVVNKKDLYKTREEVADKFLQDNDVPSELLKVLKTTKPKTTVADLITQLSNINPETDLEEEYWKVLKQIQAIYLNQIGGETNTTSEYWGCSCETQYIHHRTEDYCPDCKSERNSSPDSSLLHLIQVCLS